MDILLVLFFILFILVFGRLFIFALKATWTVWKILLTLVFLPIIVIIFALTGLLFLALPIVIVVGIISFFIK